MLAPANPLVFTIQEFCDTHRISRAMYYSLPAGERPREMRVGPRRVLITAESAAAWRNARSASVAA
jgi:hypothetical protein